MERFVKGEVVIVPFPFSDLTQTKRRPALVIAELQGDDIILCQITSQNTRDNDALVLTDSDFIQGSISQISNIRPNRIFTADQSIIQRKIGLIKREKIKAVIDKIIDILQK
ncbi:MAG: type II toxin-antitoxin system PemK/MazF family toxin [Planctomycetota bacterium]